MKIIFVLAILAFILFCIWISLSQFFGKVGKVVVKSKDKVKDNITNSEEDFWNE